MSTSSEYEEIIQYVPFMSFVHPSFWHTLGEEKLKFDKLKETTKQIFGRYSYRDDIDAVFEIDGMSFNKTAESEISYINVTGTIMNKNTIEDFKNIDKASLLNSIGEVIWSSMKNETWIDNPSSLVNFFVLSFADLKKFHYYYWFAFPTPNQPVVYVTEKSCVINKHYNCDELQSLAFNFKALDIAQKSFFIITKDKLEVQTLSSVLKQRKKDLDLDFSKIYFAFADPSNNENPGWPLRMFLAVLLEYMPNIRKDKLNIIGVRCKRDGTIDNSRMFSVKISENVRMDGKTGWVGWERNDKGKFGPKLANMSASMDPVKLADASSDLNIQLMKWRLVPDLNVEIMKNTKCLLLGAGTLGCHVARNLLAWGFRHITFIDNGKVSFSNPCRQVLYNYEDCLNGGKRKAEAAAASLKRIIPTVNSEGLSLHIPMPGHPVGESLKQETLQNIDTITKAIQDHDVIFLLLDSREARWLPTLLGGQYGKIVINAALGFDSYLVMRHGTAHCAAPPPECSAPTHVPGTQLGCYFCNDVTAPGNSMEDRTLDQQCTVTRPGVSAVAGALAVELLVALLQHPAKVDAPASYRITDKDSQEQGILGPIPHSIRGFLHSYQSVTPTCVKFPQCIACSEPVGHKYLAEGTQFLLDVFNSGKYLEELTGLTKLHDLAEMTEILALSDDDDE